MIPALQLYEIMTYTTLHCTWPDIPLGILMTLWKFTCAIYTNWIFIKDCICMTDWISQQIYYYYNTFDSSFTSSYAALCHISSRKCDILWRSQAVMFGIVCITRDWRWEVKNISCSKFSNLCEVFNWKQITHIILFWAALPWVEN